MNYTILWTPDAEQELAAVWLAATDRQAVTNAAARVDQFLLSKPATSGYPRSGPLRTLVVQPLAVHFVVFTVTRTVYVVAVWEPHIAGNGAI